MYPLGGAVFILLAVLVAELAAASSDYYTGGLGLPYLTDLARDGGMHAFYAFNVSIACLFFIFQHTCNSPRYAQTVSAALGAKQSASAPPFTWLCVWMTACGLCCLAFMALLWSACVSVARQPALHSAAIEAYFLLLAPAMCMMSVVLLYLRYEMPPAVSVASVQLKLVVTAAYWFFLLLYLLLLFALPRECQPTALLAQDCATRPGLSDAYCTAYLLSDGASSTNASGSSARAATARTTLTDYSSCSAAHTVRAWAQLICLLLSIIFHASFVAEEVAIVGVLAADADASAHGTGGPKSEAAPLNASAATPAASGAPAPALAFAPTPTASCACSPASAMAFAPSPAAGAPVSAGCAAKSPMPAAASPSPALSRSLSRPAAPPARDFAEKQLSALYEQPPTLGFDPEEVRVNLPSYAAGSARRPYDNDLGLYEYETYSSSGSRRSREN